MNRLEEFILENKYAESEILTRIREQYVKGFIGFKFASMFLKEYYSPSKEAKEIYWDNIDD